MDRLSDIFRDQSLLEWLPDETVFSLVSRHHHLWGHSVAHRTAKHLFGHSHGGAHHDLPSYLGNFVERTSGVHGPVEKLALDHTLLKYYAVFMPQLEVDNAIACMASQSVAHLKLRLGILTSRFRANHPLKACKACIAEDGRTEGWAYWHLEHQYPGVWICSKHGHLLGESFFKSSGVQRFQWNLPSADGLRPWSADQLTAIAGAKTEYMDFSQFVLNIINRATSDPIDPYRLHEIYRVELRRRSWLTPGGSLRMPSIAESYLQYVRPMRALPELSALPETVEAAGSQLGIVLRAPRGGTHPLRHLLVMSWLFVTPEKFWSAYRSLQDPTGAPPVYQDSGKEECPARVVLDDSRKETLIRVFSQPGASLRSAADAVGVDVATAMAWTAKAGLQSSRRPKKLKTELRSTIIAELTKGADKQGVADRAGLSMGTITRLLLTEVGLHAIWTKTREDKARAFSRQAWLSALKMHPGVGIKFIRAMEPGAYGWLYRNDRSWLDAHKPSPAIATTAQRSSPIAWDARDEVLSAKVRQAIHSMQIKDGQKRFKLWQIYQAVPELKAKLTALPRLPLTRQAIDDALRRAPLTPTPGLFD